MLLKEYAWDFDPHGTNPNNLIVGERHTLTPTSGNGFHFFVPKASPFFIKDIKIVHLGTGRTLFEGADWQSGWMFQLASSKTYMPVYGAISILDRTLNGTFEISYRTIGGEYTMDDAALLEKTSNVLTDPRTTTWEAIQGTPLYFPPIAHQFSTEDLVGMEESVEALDRIRDAILQSINALYPSINVHLADRTNPHATTKAQVGLGQVEDYPMASDAEATAGVARNRYMSPATTSVMVAALSSQTVAGHAADHNNPHVVTKAQVGLGNVDNFRTATSTEALQGTATNLFMTPANTAALITQLAISDFDTHLNNTSNPHATTKAQVGLGSVDNYATATNADADAATATNKFGTVAIIKRMIDTLVATSYNAHNANRSNPHAVTKAQIGLGNVLDFGVANTAELDEGTATNKYTTVAGVKQMVQRFGVSGLDVHLSDVTNPHEVTKDQVGLGLVNNFDVADSDELDAGVATNKYTTVAGVKQMVQRFGVTGLDAHLNDVANPHEVTKEQVGLGLVSNFDIANSDELDAGVATNKYVNVAGVRQMVQRFGVSGLDIHLADISNPHQVTKAQVGLGNVLDYGVADDTELASGTATNKYVNVAGVKQMITIFGVSGLDNHLADESNPHNTTKAQVGLGSVENYAVATQQEATEGTVTNRYMTPLLVSQAVSSQVGTALNTHATNTANPHNTTKAQVGLGSVDNFATASNADADTATATNKFGTVAIIKRMIDNFASGAFTTHTSNTSNPHNTTKAQVGLGLVDNFATASAAEASAGTATNKFGTVAIIKQMIDGFVGSAFVIHRDNVNNPHAVTKAQVGLGLVNNYGTANDSDAINGSATDLYITPANLKAALDQRVPDNGAGDPVTRISLQPVTVAIDGILWSKFAEHDQNDVNDAYYEVYGGAVDGSPIHVTVRGDASDPVRVTEDSGGSLTTKFCSTFDSNSGIRSIWICCTVGVADIQIIRLGKGGRFVVEPWVSTEPEGARYYAIDSAIVKNYYSEMRSESDLIDAFLLAVDELDSKALTNSSFIPVGAEFVDVSTETERYLTWSKDITPTGTGGTYRIDFDDLEVFGGTVQIFFNGVSQSLETIEAPAIYRKVLELPAGTTTVSMQVRANRNDVRAPIHTSTSAVVSMVVGTL